MRCEDELTGRNSVIPVLKKESVLLSLSEVKFEGFLMTQRNAYQVCKKKH